MDPSMQPAAPAAPPPPPGFVPMTSSAPQTPPPPPGFVPSHTGAPSAAAGGAVPTSSTTTSPAPMTVPQKIGAVVGPFSSGMIKGGMHTVAGLLKMFGTPDPLILKAAGYDENGNKNDPSSLVTGQRNTQPLIEPHMKAAADWLNAHAQDHGMWQHIGDFGESALELMTPEALASLGKVADVAKGGEAAIGLAKVGAEAGNAMAKGETALAKGGQIVETAAQKYADAAKVSKVLDSMPRIKALVMIGLRAAAKGGAEVGGQTLVKTGGDTDAALTAGAQGAALGGVLAPLSEIAGAVGERAAPVTKNIEGVEVPVPKTTPMTPAQEAAGKAYTETARATVRPHLEAMGARPAQVDQILNTVHDFTGARDALATVNDKAYDVLDQATEGKFRKLNSDVQKAQTQAWAGGPEAESIYQNKQKEMNDLLDSANVPKDLLANVKASWRQSYVLGDMGKALDKAIDGIPGDTAVSQTQRGMNGKTLQNGLRQIVNRYGRANVETALGGAERLNNLQAIADATKTNAGRQALNFGVRQAAKWLVPYLGYKAGESLTGSFAGGIMGASAAEAAAMATERVYRAIAANPKIGQNLLFAIKSGARPENYGPLIGAMIQQNETENSNQRKAAEATQ